METISCMLSYLKRRRFFFISHVSCRFASYTCYALLFSIIEKCWKELRKICTLETTNENNNKKIITTVKNLFTFYFHTQQSTSDWLTFRVVLRSKFIFAIRLHCCKTNGSSFTWKFCFRNTNHEILWKEFSFGHFLTHAFICTCRELDLKENIPKSFIS